MASSDENTPSSSDVIKPGTLILKCDPFVYVGKWSPTKIVCDVCLREETVDYKLIRCRSCQMICYCNEACQKKGWKKGHKYECPQIKRILERGAFSYLLWLSRMLLRVVIKLQDGTDHFEEFQVGETNVKRRFHDLVSNQEKFRANAGQNVEMEFLIRLTKEFLANVPKIEMPSDAELFEMCAKIRTNVHEIQPDGSDNSGFGLYLGGSIFDHSCNCTAEYTFEGTSMCVRNFREIPKPLRIDKVTLSYISTLMPTPERRKKLMEQWHFHCECERCATGKFDKEMRSVICRNNNCNEIIEIEKIRDPCTACGSVLGKKEVEEVIEAENYALQQLKAGKLNDLKSVQICLMKMKATKFPYVHWLVVVLMNQAAEYYAAYIATQPNDLEYWKMSHWYGLKYLSGVRFYSHPNEIDLLRIVLRVASSALVLAQLDEAERLVRMDQAEKYFVEAKSIAEILYGKDSQFVKTRIDRNLEIIREQKILNDMKQLEID